MLEGVVGPRPDVRDIAELVADALEHHERHPQDQSRRPYTHTAEGLKRIVLGQSASVGEDASTPAQPAPPAPPSPAQPGARRAPHARGGPQRTRRAVGRRAPAVAAAALLAQADTAVHLLVFGDCRDDPAALGADMLIQAQAPAAHAPDLALAALLAEIAGDPPLHIFMSDEDPDDADLGRRLGAHTGYTAATGVVSLNASEAFRMAGPAQLARCPLPASCCWPPTPSTRPCPAPAVACAASSPGRRRPRAIANRRASLDAAELALEEADLIVSAGNGVHDLESFHALATALGAAVGASRVPVDDGRFPVRSRSAPPAKPSAPACTWRSASPARSSTCRASRIAGT